MLSISSLVSTRFKVLTSEGKLTGGKNQIQALDGTSNVPFLVLLRRSTFLYSLHRCTNSFDLFVL